MQAAGCEKLFSEKQSGTTTGGTDRHRDAFNAVVDERMAGVRDYIVAHYKLNTCADTEYWRANAANMALSEPLLHLLDLWFRRGDMT